MEKTVRILEIVRAGDVYLLRFTCMNCNEACIQSIPFTSCVTCGQSFSDYSFNLKGADKRTLAGSRRSGRHVTKKVVRCLNEIQNGMCGYCSRLLSEYHVDHIWPIAAGGTNDVSNLVLACPNCNRLAASYCFNSFDEKRAFVLKRLRDRREE